MACGNSHLACEWIRVYKLSQRYILGICAVWCVWGCTDGGGLYVPCRYLHTAGIEIVRKNANFCGGETDFPQRKTIVPGEKKLAVQKKGGEKKGSPRFSSAPNTSEHTECVHMQLSPVFVTQLWTQSHAVTLTGWQQAWTQSFLDDSALCFS